MDLFSGLEKFGIKAEENMTIFAEEKKQTVVKDDGSVEVKEETHSESEFLLEKAVRCACCDKVFKTKQVKSGRVKRLEADSDLRPRHQYIDTLKYNVTCCPFCGYTALSNEFDHVSSIQRKLIQEKISANFDPQSVAKAYDPETSEWDYETSIGIHKLSLFNTIVKNGKTSERAYNCLILSWLIRGYVETLPKETEEDKNKIAGLKKEEDEFYKMAYDGFTKAISTENFPICGMDTTTVDYLLATMAHRFGELETASKMVASILTNRAVSQGVKNKALNLKDQIIADIKSKKS